MTSPEPSTASGLAEPPLNSWNSARCGLAITWVSTLRRPRCGMPTHDLLDAEIAAALDDLLQRRDQRFGAVEPEALGAGEFDVAELLEALGLDQLRSGSRGGLRG